MPKVTGIYSGVKPFVYSQNELDALDDYIDTVIKSGRWNSIVNMVMVPFPFFSSSLPENGVSKTTQFTVPWILDGYLPRNRKLNCYPYSLFQIDAITDVHNYRYEWIMDNPDEDHSFTIVMDGCAAPNPQIIIYPDKYRGQSTPVSEGVVISEFPQCAFPIDSYDAWLAMKSTQYDIDMASGVIGTLGSIASGNLVGAALGAMGIMSTMNANVLEATTNDRIKATQGSSALIARDNKNVILKHLTVKREVAESIDQFFDRYGYATEKLKVPNTNVRPHWTYTQTKDCAIGGNVPAFYARKIEEVFNKGVTFWRSIAEVGNFSLDNSV